MNALRVVVLLFSVLLFLSPAACVNEEKTDTFQERQAAAEQDLATVERVQEAFGIRGVAIVRIGPGRAGMFNGFLWDSGISIDAVLEADPKSAAAGALALRYIKSEGMDTEVAIKTASEETGAKIVVPAPASATAESAEGKDEPPPGL